MTDLENERVKTWSSDGHTWELDMQRRIDSAVRYDVGEKRPDA